MSELLVGTSGWSYPSWRPAFYPAGADPSTFLELYGTRLSAVELNSTGYRLPSEEQFERWAAAVPDGFRFVVKAPPGAMRRLATLEERVRRLGDRLGCMRVVIETPRDEGLIELLLGSAEPSIRWALDLRHESWAGIELRLAEAGAVRVGDLVTPSTWRYLRFRDPPYDTAALEGAAATVRTHRDRGEAVLAFFRHEREPTAPEYALRLRELVGA